MVCSCGSQDLKAIKFGGEYFKLADENKMVLLATQGFRPDIFVCTQCRQVLFQMPEKEFNKLMS